MFVVRARSLRVRFWAGMAFVVLAFALLFQGANWWWPLLTMIGGTILAFMAISGFILRDRNPEYCQLLEEFYELLRSRPTGNRKSLDGAVILRVHEGKVLVRQERCDETEDNYVRIVNQFALLFGRVDREYSISRIIKKRGGEDTVQNIQPPWASHRDALRRPRQLARHLRFEAQIGHSFVTEEELRILLDEWKSAFSYEDI